ncbi:hypothetical protein CK203_047451 [Vitis vinifera]|uniref:Uncharacterized protein n=1 Tax=Vitis vinifera TaxID=29760 RepID=A0A438H687_VITVI|nr:hypothetical protein CK203_047451 [Vitis vinifera]
MPSILDNREKKKNEGTLRKAPGQKRGAASPPNKTPAKKRKLVKKNGKGVKEPLLPRILPFRQLLMRRSTPWQQLPVWQILAEEAASINHPDSPTPDVDAIEAVCSAPMEEAGAESQSQPSDDPDRLALVLVKGPPSKRPRSTRNLRSDSSDGFKIVSKRSKLVAHPPTTLIRRGAKWRWQLSLQPSGGDLVDDAACTSASLFSYTELEDKLKQIPSDSTTVMPSAKMFEMVETRKNSEDQLRLRLAEAEAVYPPLGGRMRPPGKLADAKSREESTITRLHLWLSLLYEEERHKTRCPFNSSG